MRTDVDDPTQRALKQNAQIDAFTQKVLLDMVAQTERQRVALSPAHERMLEYFWDSKKKAERADLPLSVLYFFELSDSAGTLRMVDESKVDLAVAELVAKGYVQKAKRRPDQFNFMVRDEDILTLTTLGSKVIWQKHPRAFVWWTKLLEATPSSISFLLALIGFIAAVLGIIDVVGKWMGHNVQPSLRQIAGQTLN